MAKLTYLQLTNRVLRRLTIADVTDVTSLSGRAQLVADTINEAQNALFAEPTHWYSLYTTRAFTTAYLSAATISFANANPDTIDDSGSGMGAFADKMELQVSGSSSNDGTYTIGTAGAAQLILQTTDALTAESAGDTMILIAYTHPVATDFGRCIDLMDLTNNNIILEGYGRGMDQCDPDMTVTGPPTSFIVQGDNYRFYPIPSSATKIRERYWKIPTALAANGDTSDLPVECENCLIQWAWAEVLRYTNSFDKADRVQSQFNKLLGMAKSANQKRLDKMFVMQNRDYVHSLGPRFPSEYGFG